MDEAQPGLKFDLVCLEKKLKKTFIFLLIMDEAQLGLKLRSRLYQKNLKKLKKIRMPNL